MTNGKIVCENHKSGLKTYFESQSLKLFKNQTEIVMSSEIQNALDKRYFKIKMVAKLLIPNPPQEGLITKDLFYGKGHAMKSCETFEHKSNEEKSNGLCFGCLGKKVHEPTVKPVVPTLLLTQTIHKLLRLNLGK